MTGVLGRGGPGDHIRYEDVLRAIGSYVDQNHWHDILITQLPDGVLLRGMVEQPTPQGLSARVVALLFTHDDIAEMLRAAETRRRGR